MCTLNINNVGFGTTHQYRHLGRLLRVSPLAEGRENLWAWWNRVSQHPRAEYILRDRDQGNLVMRSSELAGQNLGVGLCAFVEQLERRIFASAQARQRGEVDVVIAREWEILMSGFVAELRECFPEPLAVPTKRYFM